MKRYTEESITFSFELLQGSKYTCTWERDYGIRMKEVKQWSVMIYRNDNAVTMTHLITIVTVFKPTIKNSILLIELMQEIRVQPKTTQD